jgi:hypothetical protein
MATLDLTHGDLVRAEMLPGEQLRWVGSPSPAALMRSRQGFFWGGLLFLAFSILWEMIVWFGQNASPRPLLLLWGIPFILVGVGLVLYAPASFWLARRMAYAVTDRRVLILEGFPRRRTGSFWPVDLNPLEVTERADGHGDIIFRQRVIRSEEGSSETLRDGFFGIAAVRDVAGLIDDLRDTRGTALSEIAAVPSSDLPGRVAALLIPGEAALWYGRQGRVDGLGGRVFRLAMALLFVAIIFGGEPADGLHRWLPLSWWSVIPMLIAGAIGWQLLSELAGLIGARQNLYVLTETRLIVLPPWPFAGPRSFSLAHISGIERTSRPDGTGDIRFQHPVKRGTGDAAEYATSGLFGIADARDVEELLTRRVSIRPLALTRVP